MTEVSIKDMELLNKKKQNIIDLEKKIEILPEILELKKLQQEERKLKNKILKYSTNDTIMIGNAIARLMTFFEGVEYCCSRNEVLFLDCDYYIKPQLSNRDYISIYPSYKIKNIKQKYVEDDKERCCLLPSDFPYDTESSCRLQDKETLYVQLFIDYLYERRSSSLIEEISDDWLEGVLQDFLMLTPDLQQKRKIEIADKLEEQNMWQKRREFEDSCVINRKLIFNSLVYIINHYEENMTATQKKEIIYTEYFGDIDTYFYKLIIESLNNKVFFDVEIGSDIRFFELKRALLPVLKDSMYALDFMKRIEMKYIEKGSITLDDIHSLLVFITNDKKSKKRILKKVCD